MKIFARLFALTIVFSLGLPAVVGAASGLPAGFIALSKSEMNWNDAKTFCQQQGGRLPRISWDNKDKLTIDGFGTPGSPSWPSGLPDEGYWSGTEDTDAPGHSLLIAKRGSDHVEIVYNFSQSYDAYAICVPSGAASNLPSGVIALAESEMNWKDAVAYCKQQGGRLPRVNNSDSYSWDIGKHREKVTIDVFGAEGTPLPPGLPHDTYWTGTEVTGSPGFSLLLFGDDGSVDIDVGDFRQSDNARVVCVSETAHSAKPEARSTGKTHTNSIGMEFVLIPAGSFPVRPYEKTDDFGEKKMMSGQGNVKQAFYLGKYPVTQEQWVAVMGTGSNPSQFKGRTNPVESVTRQDVQTFIQRLNKKEGHNRYRLPTEMEWEHAARGGTTTKYFFGEDAAALGEYAWFNKNSGRKTHPVGQKKPNPYGLYDIYGNVAEIVQSWYNWPPITPDAMQFNYNNEIIHILPIRGGNIESDPQRCSSDNRIPENWIFSKVPPLRDNFQAGKFGEAVGAAFTKAGLRFNQRQPYSSSYAVGFRLALSLE